MDKRRLGQIAYEAYFKKRGCLDLMPAWDSIPGYARAEWEAAGWAAVKAWEAPAAAVLEACGGGMAESHRCRDCSRCGCDEERCSATCDWDCECPDYPPPEEQPHD